MSIRKKIARLAAPVVLFSVLASGACVFAGPKEQAEECYSKGNAYYLEGKYKEAQEQFQKALEILNTSPVEPVVERKPVEERPVAVTSVTKEPVAVQLSNASVREYMIGEDDVLYISVWQNQDLDQEAIVRPDGRLSFPLIGDLEVMGLTIPQLDALITEKLAEYIKHPEVSVSIRKMGGKRVIVLGQVKNPGLYAVTGARNIMDAVAMAGGFTRDAVPSSTVLIRGGLVSPNAQRINLSKVFKGDLKQNLPLQSEDIIFIPRKFISNINYFLTQITEPLSQGAYANKQFQTW